MSSYKEITKWYADHLDEALDDNKALRTKLEVAEERVEKLEALVREIFNNDDPISCYIEDYLPDGWFPRASKLLGIK